MRVFYIIIYFLILTTASEAQDFDSSFVLSDEETLKLSGNLDSKYSLYKTRKTSPLYNLMFYNQDLSDVLSSYRMELYINGDYQTKDLGVHVKTHSEYYNDNQFDINLFELYGNISLFQNMEAIIGKKMFNWGKGYAFNPVGYVNTIKDPENPELAKSGIFSINLQYSKSFQSDFINNMAFDLIVIPSIKTINNKISELEYTDLSVKLYFLIWDTDVDLMGYYSKANSSKIGIDFSRNILPSLEIHCEYSLFDNHSKYTVSDSILMLEKISGSSYLIGIRWLNELNMTFILEYYHNDAGLLLKEYEEYNKFLLNAISSENNISLSEALNMNKNYFTSPNLMQNYLYLKISLPEPFNWVDFTPALYTIYNLNDNSFIIGMPLSYKPVTNFEFILWPTIIIGYDSTEYGSKQYKEKLDMWMRFYF